MHLIDLILITSIDCNIKHFITFIILIFIFFTKYMFRILIALLTITFIILPLKFIYLLEEYIFIISFLIIFLILS